MKDKSPRRIRLQDYRPPDFLVEHLELCLRMDAAATQVSARLELCRNPEAGAGERPLVLDGEHLDTRSVRLDGVERFPQGVSLDGESMTIDGVPERCVLETEVVIHPERNTALEGLYLSGDFLLTQCEPEGFRRITWMVDRPDVLARYRVRLEAPRGRYPVLLSNGNLVSSGDLERGWHFAEWDDPFPKPSYLFAIVAGDLGCLEDHFEKADGGTAVLRLYAERENLGRLDHAMASLKRAMAWDEERFGLVYDLGIYHIVASNDFNMGAMENKSLNIFNARYVLADPEVATDQDYRAIEGVIGHEYFHNWTGNRVTCRDWFQLSLKEGLTVFRDQEFSADMQSAAVKRIEDVRMLRSMQFAEDAGPMAHPVRPESYLEINNFYTLTVYEKGAEVVRMLHTLLGEEAFRAGLRRYLERHDGEAATCEDFLRAMAEAAGVELGQFARWYAQAGTPELTVEDDYDPGAQRYRLRVRQHTPPTPGQARKEPLHIPLRLGLVGSDGQDLPLHPEGATPGGEGDVLELRAAEETFVFTGVPERPVPSLLRGFSAPVKLRYPYAREQLAFLMAHDSDAFARWDAAQRLATDVILEQVAALQEGARIAPDPLLLEAARRLLRDTGADPALLAEALRLPAEDELAQQLGILDVDRVHAAREATMQAIARSAGADLPARYEALATPGPYRPEAAAVGRRALRNTLLAYLLAGDPEGGAARAWRQFQAADNMTDRLAALQVLSRFRAAEAAPALAAFEARHGGDPLAMDKWLAVQAAVPGPDTLAIVQQLLEHPAFELRNPNRVRALLGTFSRNPTAFHRADGSAYRFLAEQIAALDALNPQVAARLAAAFNHYRKLPEPRRLQAEAQLRGLLEARTPSPDLYEIVSRALA